MPMIHPRRSLFAALLAVIVVFCGLAVNSAPAQLPTARLESLFPAGGKVGATFEVEVDGENLDEAKRLLFSHPGIQSEPMMLEPDELHDKPYPKPNTFVVTIGKNVPVGMHEVRLVGRYGISNPRAFVVGTRDEMQKQGDPDSPDKAMELQIGTTLNGRIGAQEIDYYRIDLKQGQKVVFDLWGERLDSKINAAMKLRGPNGAVLRRVRNVNRGDPVIALTIPATGTYQLEIYDFTYRGGNDYTYRLTIDTRPEIRFVYPPVGTPGTRQAYTVYGHNLPNGHKSGEKLFGTELEETSLDIALPNGDEQIHKLPVAPAVPPKSGLLNGKLFRINGKGGRSNAVLVQYATAPVVLEEESQEDGPDVAQRVPIPCEFVGRLYPRHDVDWISFEAKKGQTYWINLLGNRLDTFADPTLVIERVTQPGTDKEKVDRIATVDDEGSNNRRRRTPILVRTESVDPQYKLTADRDALIRIRVKDLYGNPTSDPRFVYRLIIQKAKPDFSVMAHVEPAVDRRNQVFPSSAAIRRGGSKAVQLKVFRRRGFTGKVEVSAVGLPDGVKTSGAVIDGKVEKGWLVFTADENAKFWAGPVKLVAKAKVDGKDITRDVRLATIVWGADRNGNGGRSRMSGSFALAVIDAETAPVTLQAGNGKMFATAHGGKLQIPVKVARREKLKGDLKVESPSLHRDLSISATNVKKDSGKVQLEVRDDDVPPGIYTFYLRGESRFRYNRNQDAVKRAEALQKKASELVNQRKKDEQTAEQKRDAARKAAQTAEKELKETQQKLNDAKKKADETAKRLKDAEQKLAEAKKAAAENKDKEKAKPLAEALKKAEQKLDEAKKQNEQAATELKSAQTALAEAKKKDESAKTAAKKAEEAAKQAEDRREKAERLKKQADDDVKNAKNRNKPQDVTLRVASNAIRLRIVEQPFEFVAPDSPLKLKQGESLDVPLKVKRLFGFDDNIDVSISLSGVKGVKVEQKDISKGKSEAPLKLTAGDDATPGKHQVSVRLRSRLGRVSHDVRKNFPIEIVKVDKPKKK